MINPFEAVPGPLDLKTKRWLLAGTAWGGVMIMLEIFARAAG